jgi:ATP-dependent DNA helicase RecG
MIESWGSGTLKVLSLCREAGLPEPTFEATKSLFSITFYSKVTDKVTDNQRHILKAVMANNKVTTAELAKRVGISQRKIKENLKKPETKYGGTNDED